MAKINDIRIQISADTKQLRTQVDASKKKINSFNWKSQINVNKDWSFESTMYSASEYNWNFMNGYQMMFYYRV